MGIKEDPVIRYCVVPFALWLILSLLSLLFRWQSRKLMMTGYLHFYRKSSWLWKVTYGVASSAYCLGSTYFLLTTHYISNEDQTSRCYWHVDEDTRRITLFIFWTLVFGTLFVLYTFLLLDFIKHNRRRMLPDGVKASDYHQLADGPDSDKEVGGRIRRGSGKNKATLRRQAVTIRYLEKQLRALSDQLIDAQNAGKLTSRSLDDGRFFAPQAEEIQSLLQEKQLMASEIDTLNAHLASRAQEVTGMERQVNNLQAIRTRLEAELHQEREAVASKQDEVNELQILLAVEREAADQARVFFEEFQLGQVENKRSKKG